MPAAVYNNIYNDLKSQVTGGVFGFGDVLPSESELCRTYDCSRNTVRRALALLADEGYTQSRAGSGTRVIWRPAKTTSESLGQLSSFRELAQQAGKVARNEVIELKRVVADKRLAELTGFPLGGELVFVSEVRILDETPVQFDEHWFPVEVAADLTREQAEWSIFEYLEKVRGYSIATSKRLITIERPRADIRQHLGLGRTASTALVRSQTFCIDGSMIEFTLDHIHPDYFCYADTTVRRRIDMQ